MGGYCFIVQLVKDKVYLMIERVTMYFLEVRLRSDVFFVSDAFRNRALTNKTPVWVTRDRCLDLVLSILRLLFIIELDNMSLPFSLMILPFIHDIFVLSIRQ
jgi:hypothetical protein